MELPRGRFALIMADPPWKFATYSKKGLGKSPEAHYQTMTLADIRALDVASIALDDAVLWLWTTWPMLLDGEDPAHSPAGAVMKAWDFRYSTGGAWAKRTKHGKASFGTGFRLRSACEPFLIGVRGSPKTTRSIRNLVDDLAREHSRKPEKAYQAAVELMPDVARLDLFGREQRAGWLTWGDQAHKFNRIAVGQSGTATSELSPWAPSPPQKRSPRDPKSLSGSATASR